MVLAGDVPPAGHSARAARRVLGVQIPDAQLRQMETAGRAVRPTDTGVRHHGRRDRGPRAAGRPGASAIPPVRRATVFRRVRGPPSRAGAARPATGARRHGQGFRFVQRSDREQRVVPARQAVRALGQPAGRAVAVDQGEVEPDVFRGQTQIDDGRHWRVHGTANSQLERTSRDERRYVFKCIPSVAGIIIFRIFFPYRYVHLYICHVCPYGFNNTLIHLQCRHVQ